MARNIVLSPEQIQEVTTRLGLELNEALKGAKKVPLIVGVMKGSLNFMMDLIKHISLMSGILLYGISHNGIRNTLLWILLSFMLLIKSENEYEEEELEESA